MDEVDAPLSIRRQKPKSKFQVELDAKMRERRSKGLAADISEESEPIDDDDDDEEESDEDFLSQYRSTLKTRPDRPSSAKRRQEHPPLGDTLRPGEAAKWLKKSDDKKQKTMKENILLEKIASPKSSLTEKSMTKEEVIFGRKTPTNELKNKDQSWLPPSFQRSSPTQEQISPRNRAQSPGARSQSPHSSKGGRKTHQDQLQTISEGLTPVPKQRFPSPTDKTQSRESTPRTLSVSSSPRSDQQTPRLTPRIKPKTDLFGKTEQVEVNLDSDDEKKNTAARNRRRFTDSKALDGRKTPTDRKTPTGRQTPIGRQTPTEQLTAIEQKTPAGRLTPGQKSVLGRKTPDIETKKEKEIEKTRFSKEPSVLDFLQEGIPSPKKKTPSVLDSSDTQSQHKRTPSVFDKKEREKPLHKSESNDSITEELVPTKSPKQKRPSLERRGSESSLCDEIEKDPTIAQESEKPPKQKPAKQRSETASNENAISAVEDAQNKGTLLKLIQPEDNKKKRSQDDSAIKRPKPRHSLPGSAKSSRTNLDTESFNSTMSIRQAIYEEWRREKKKKTLKELEEKKKKEAELETKKQKEKEDKIKENQATFTTWKEQKEVLLKQQAKEKRNKEKEAEDKKKKEEEEKINEAKKNFLIWKERKDEIIQEKNKKQQEEQKKMEKEKASEKKEKEKESESAFKSWKEKKDKKLIEEHARKYQENKEVKNKVAEQEKQKESDANQIYLVWMKKKEEQEVKERERKRKQKKLEETGEIYIPAWSPPNRTIPFGR